MRSSKGEEQAAHQLRLLGSVLLEVVQDLVHVLAVHLVDDVGEAGVEWWGPSCGRSL